MNKRSKGLRLVLVLLLAAAVTGCNLIQVNEERDRQQVVAEINGEKVLKGAFLDELDMTLASQPNAPSPDQMQELQENVLDHIVRQTLILQKAKAAGFELNEEVRARAEAELLEELSSYAEDLRERAEAAAEVNDADPEETDYMLQAEEMLDNWLASAGLTRSQYIERLAVSRVIRDYMEEMTRDIEIEDAEVERFYEEELEFQLKSPMYAPYSQVLIVKEPEMRRVKHILIMIPQEDQNEIAALRRENKTEDADALYQQKLEAIRPRAEEALAKAKADESFEGLIQEYGEDPGMEQEQFLDGYTMTRDAQFLPEFKEAAFALRTGEISGLVPTQNGYHILKVYEDRDNEIAPLSEVQEDLRTALENEARSKRWNELIEEWVEAASIRKYPRRLN